MKDLYELEIWDQPKGVWIPIDLGEIRSVARALAMAAGIRLGYSYRFQVVEADTGDVRASGGSSFQDLFRLGELANLG